MQVDAIVQEVTLCKKLLLLDVWRDSLNKMSAILNHE